MKLRDKHFERATRKLIAAEVRRNPKLKPESIKSRNDAKIEAFIGLVLIACISPMAWILNDLPFAGLASLSIALFGWTIFNPHRWITPFYRDEDLWTLTHLPFSNEAIWSAQWHRYRTKVIGLGVTLLLIYIICSVGGAWTMPLAIMPLVAIPQAFLILAVGVHLAAYPLPIPWQKLGLIAVLPLAIFGIWKFGWIESPPFGAAFILPTSWFHNVALAAIGEYSRLHLLWLIPAIGLIAMLPHSVARLRGYFLWWLYYVFTPEAQSQADAETPEPEKIPIHDEAGDRVIGPTALIDATLSGISLAPPAFQATGFIEKLALRFFNERERTLAGFIWFGGVNWTKTWRLSAYCIIGASILAALLGKGYSAGGVFALGFVVAGFALPIVRSARGLEQWQVSSGLAGALYSGFPISYGELVGTLGKASLARFACALPLLIFYGIVVSFPMEMRVLTGVIIAIKTWFMILLLQPIIITRWISDSISMTQKGGNTTLGLVFIFIFVLLPLLLVAGALSGISAYYGFAFGIGAISFGVLFYHRALYRGRGVDCLKPPVQ
jgi:hypothetical protein